MAHHGSIYLPRYWNAILKTICTFHASRYSPIIVIPAAISPLSTSSFLNRPVEAEYICSSLSGYLVRAVKCTNADAMPMHRLEKGNRSVATIALVPTEAEAVERVGLYSVGIWIVDLPPRNRADQPMAAAVQNRVHAEKTVYSASVLNTEHRPRPFRTIALLMPKGWSRFKRELYTRSVDHYRCRSTVPAVRLGRTYISPWCTFVLMRSQR